MGVLGLVKDLPGSGGQCQGGQIEMPAEFIEL